MKNARAPNDKQSAILFQRDCGATTAFSTQVSVVALGEEAGSTGNVFIADDAHGAAAVGDWGGTWADIRWIAPDRLVIRFAAHSRIFKQEDQVSGVTITYESVER